MERDKASDLKEFGVKGHFPQKERYSCIPASVRTVIYKKFNKFISEYYIRKLLEMNNKRGGTTLKNLIKLEELGYKAECKRMQINDILQEDLPVICFINRDWGDTTSNHAVAIDKIDENKITILNPGHCTEKYGKDIFDILHAGGSKVVIYISKIS
ncbi:hypothetical protein BEH94_10980 [Candidatus Altiarchaeales archaeon WOR_SM1_SCG]|nr:hypothetical protein BEH94_10980 [Candidatus Altiarchaeales archaeon WOR_SM1_SCG]